VAFPTPRSSSSPTSRTPSPGWRVSLAVGIVYLGAKRAIALDSSPIKDAIGTFGEAAAA
jgi:hypothetical protein